MTKSPISEAYQSFSLFILSTKKHRLLAVPFPYYGWPGDRTLDPRIKSPLLCQLS
ncbi:Protein of unknown function [Lactobacillus helveticus CIRM-BIA 953]|uniref:Uncharacterized protein n=1 Tax=Lactobacillus helveticus CIRM-BIA 953 TaxID=1226335 RepID=U4QLS9_LACHE|nr:Protein of unknown function [Lactobacillus helveticus CIRM-BIA 953]